MKLAKQNIVLRTGMKLLRNGASIFSLLLILSGCGSVTTPTFVICYKDYNTTYVYDDKGNYYSLIEDEIIPIRDVGLSQYPIMVITSCKDYNLDKVTEGKYRATINDVSGYVNKLLESGFIMRDDYCVYASDKMKLYLDSEDITVRIIYTSDGYMRAYAKYTDGTYCTPPYIVTKVYKGE